MIATLNNNKQLAKYLLFAGEGIFLRIALVLLVICASITIPSSSYSSVTADFLFEFGSYGKEAGMFREPRALAIDMLGDVYVADTKNNRVQVFGPSGDFLRQWGGEGSEQGLFDTPSGIAFGNDRVYVADTDNHRIQIFDPRGNFIDSFGSKGSDPKEFRKPMGVTWWNSLLYVADTGNNRIQVFTEDGIFLYQIKSGEGRALALEKPYSLSIDQLGNIYVIGDQDMVNIFSQKGKPLVSGAIKGNAICLSPDGIFIANRFRIFRFTHDSSLKQFFVSQGNNELQVSGQLSEISAIAINRIRNLYVLASKQGRIKVFRTTAEPVNFVPEERPSSVVFSRDINIPSSVILSHFNDTVFTFDKEKEKISLLNEKVSSPAASNKKSTNEDRNTEYFWVIDTEKHCLKKFDSSGKLLTTVGQRGNNNGQFSYPSDIAVHNNYLYVADSGNARIQMFDENGKFVNSFGITEKDKGNIRNPVAMAFDKNNNLYVADKDLNKVVKMDSSGNFIREFGTEGEENGQFSGPMGICVVNDEVYVLDSGNNRIQVFSADGMFLRKFASEGKGRGEFKKPSSMYVDNSYNLYIHDKFNSRIQVLKLLLTPSKPNVLKAEGTVKEVKITWLPNPEPHVVAYQIFRRQKGESDFEEIGKVDGSASFSKFAYFDKNLKSKSTYYYTVKAVSKTWNISIMSNVVEATTKSLVPSKPRILKTEAGQKDIYIEWMPSPETYTDYYIIMRNNENWQTFMEVEKTKGHSFKDTNLVPNTLYKYRIVAVGTEDDRSEPSNFEVTTKKLPTIDVTAIEVSDIFANNYKYYESYGMGRIVIKNNSENTITAIKTSLMVKDFMDYPSEAVTENLAAGESAEVPLKAVFNNRLFELSENSVLQSEITVSFPEGTESKTVSLSKPLNVFEKHALIWDKVEKASTFITPKDPAILDLATKTASGYTDIQINKPLLHARGIFESLGIMGITYMQDPNNPYQKVSKDVTTVDFIQYPRETLKRKAGDCDDLVVLYASMLESLGINTAFVTYPGHILLMFDTAISSNFKEDFGFPPDDYVIYKGTIWIPVETTLVGSSFTAAWKKAIDDFNEWKDKGLQIVDMKAAWQDYKPATIQYEDWRAEAVNPAKISEKFPKEIEALKERKVHYLRSFFLNSPDSPYALEQLAILYGENGMYEEAMETLKRHISVKGENATALNNSGNLYYLAGDYRNAETAYIKALKYDQEDSGIMINLARCYLRQNKKEKARKYLDMAIRLDPDITKKYFRLSSELRR